MNLAADVIEMRHGPVAVEVVHRLSNLMSLTASVAKPNLCVSYCRARVIECQDVSHPTRPGFHNHVRFHGDERLRGAELHGRTAQGRHVGAQVRHSTCSQPGGAPKKPRRLTHTIPCGVVALPLLCR